MDFEAGPLVAARRDRWPRLSKSPEAALDRFRKVALGQQV
jgi:hypothetical protein